MRSLSMVQKLPLTEAKCIFFAVCALSILSQVSIPLIPVPLTLQTLAIMGIGLFLPPGQAFLSVLTWITVGAMGLPVFSLLSAGPSVLLGTRGGYIMGFLAAAPLISFAYRRLVAPSTGSIIGILFMGVSIILFCGWLFLSLLLDNYALAWSLGIFPFLIPEGIKILLMATTMSFWTRRRPRTSC